MLAPGEGVVIGETEAHTFGVYYEKKHSDISYPTFCDRVSHHANAHQKLAENRRTI